jgi:hypothetical protein
MYTKTIVLWQTREGRYLGQNPTNVMSYVDLEEILSLFSRVREATEKSQERDWTKSRFQRTFTN